MTIYQNAQVEDPNVVLRGGPPKDEGALVRLSIVPGVSLKIDDVTYSNTGVIEEHPDHGVLAVYRPRP